MNLDPETCAELFDTAGFDLESLTVVLVAGGSVTEVLQLLRATGPRLTRDEAEELDEEHSAYAAVEVQGGILAMEHSGYADPAAETLAALSALGGTTAVTRSNVQGHERFGCARDGAVLFDDDEFRYVDEDEKDAVPSQLRALFDSAWVDLDNEDDDEGDDDDEGFVGFAMAALHTGLTVTAEDLERAVEQGCHRVPSLAYLD